MAEPYQEKLSTQEASNTYLAMRWAILNSLCPATNGVLRRLQCLVGGMSRTEEETKGYTCALDGLRSMTQEWEAEREELGGVIHRLFSEGRGAWTKPIGRPPSPASIALAQAEEITALIMALLDRGRSHNRMLMAILNSSSQPQGHDEFLSLDALAAMEELATAAHKEYSPAATPQQPPRGSTPSSVTTDALYPQTG